MLRASDNAEKSQFCCFWPILGYFCCSVVHLVTLSCNPDNFEDGRRRKISHPKKYVKKEFLSFAIMEISLWPEPPSPHHFKIQGGWVPWAWQTEILPWPWWQLQKSVAVAVGFLSPTPLKNQTCLFTRLEESAWVQHGFWLPSFCRKHNLSSLCFWGGKLDDVCLYCLPGGNGKN